MPPWLIYYERDIAREGLRTGSRLIGLALGQGPVRVTVGDGCVVERRRVGRRPLAGWKRRGIYSLPMQDHHAPGLSREEGSQGDKGGSDDRSVDARLCQNDGRPTGEKTPEPKAPTAVIVAAISLARTIASVV